MAGRGIYFAGLGAGILLFWSGFKGWGIVSTLQDIITGKQPHGPAINAPVDPLTSQANGQVSAAVIGGSSSIASDAMAYQGHAYSYGGAPGKDGTQPWDCSSFCNWVISHDLGLAWPGSGRYDGTSHGPPTGQWAAWFIAKGLNAGTDTSKAQSGDVVVWTGHMGIALGGGQMVSALNEQLGTLVTPIAGNGNGPLLAIGRYPAAVSSANVSANVPSARTRQYQRM